MDRLAKRIGERPDHGGGLDAAVIRFGGERSDWIDLSTGINPQPYPMPMLSPGAWTALPDEGAEAALCQAARRCWMVPDGAAVLAAPGASALIARIPWLAPAGRVTIPGPTYNEHARAFALAGWQVEPSGPAIAKVVVNPNNPDGRQWSAAEAFDGLARGGVLVVDESFADTCPAASLIELAARPGVIVLKSFGKFWGLAGLRLGFAIGDPALITRLGEMLGPWPVSGPALSVGAQALSDAEWARTSRARLSAYANRLDRLMAAKGATPLGGTDLFRLYDTTAAADWQMRLASARIWTRVFPYSTGWLRLGLPGTPVSWARLEAAL